MKKSATSNYAGFISIDKQPKKVSPSVKSSKPSEPAPESKATPRKNADSVRTSSNSTARKTTTRSELRSQSKPSTTSPSISSSKSKTKEKVPSIGKKTSQEKPKEQRAVKSKGQVDRQDSNPTNQRRSNDVSFVDETKSKFKKINETLVQSEEQIRKQAKTKRSLLRMDSLSRLNSLKNIMLIGEQVSDGGSPGNEAMLMVRNELFTSRSQLSANQTIKNLRNC
ncbi:hypothetical protein M8J77_020634 [Diaphorina citri]|nr:hypothetical protein M8J77_020634 [Diaphorina citri]